MSEDESIEIENIKGSNDLNSSEENNKEYRLSDLLNKEINPDLERGIKRQAQQKEYDKAPRERVAKRKRAKNNAFLTAQNSDKKLQNSHDHSIPTTYAQSSSKKAKIR